MEYKKYEIVVFILSLLNGDTAEVNTEDIAVKCFEIDPGRFKWMKYSYPDINGTNRALRRARQLGLIIGQASTNLENDGWRLTTKGIDWLDNHKDKIAKLLSVKDHKQSYTEQLRNKRLLKSVKSSELYESYAKGKLQEDFTTDNFCTLIKCSPDMRAEIVMIKYENLYAQLSKVGDKEIMEFLRECLQAYKDNA